MDQKIVENILTALKGLPNRLGAIGTVTEDNRPRIATIYYDFDEHLNIYFITRASTQKYKNTLQNATVAFLASADHPPRTIQLEGIASEISDPKEQEECCKRVSDIARSQNAEPPFAQMMNAEIMVMKITPTWARLGNFDVHREGEAFQTAEN